MSAVTVDVEVLRAFEAGLNARAPDKSKIPARVLGYGEISTVLEIGVESERHRAYKRLPMFRSREEAEGYMSLYRDYVATLRERIGVGVIPGHIVSLQKSADRTVIYIVQEKVPAESIGHRTIHHLSREDVMRLVRAVLSETQKVFDFNAAHRGELELGFDGQISNWAVVGYDAALPRLGDAVDLLYLDTSTPLLRRQGREQLDPELFLRSAPSFMVWIIRLLFLKEVMTRYYDSRRVAVDLVANFLKEQRADLLPDLMGVVNESLSTQAGASGFKPVTVDEVKAYYREDAMIWRVYLAFRKIDRSLHRLLRREYPYLLPDRIKR